MAQYDIYLTQNTSGAGVEFTERVVDTIAQGALISFDGTAIPESLPVGADGTVLTADSAESTGLKWSALSDTYVTKATFDANTILKADSDNTPVALTVAEQTLVGRITSGSIAALTATQVRTLLNVEDGADVTDATNVNSAGAVMESDFNAYTILAADSDDTPAPLTVSSNSLVGRAGSGIVALSVTEDTLVGRISGGSLAALTPAQAMNVIWVSAPATSTSSGTTGQVAYDGNFFYICDNTNTWIRTAMSTNWS